MKTWRRWWGVRHIRYWMFKRLVYTDAKDCAMFGVGDGQPTIADLFKLEKIWQGKA